MPVNHFCSVSSPLTAMCPCARVLTAFIFVKFVCSPIPQAHCYPLFYLYCMHFFFLQNFAKERFCVEILFSVYLSTLGIYLE